MENGKKFPGIASPLHKSSKVYMMMGPNDTFYWASLTDNEINNEDSFDKVVNYGKFRLIFFFHRDEE